MDYTIKSGDTLSQIAKAHNTTVEALVKANQIADPNKIIAGNVLKLPEIQQTTGVDISASEITTGIPEIPQAIPEIKPDTNANAILAYTTSEKERIAREKEELEKTAKKMLGTTDLLTAYQNRPTIDLATTRTKQLESTGATALREEVAQQNLKVAEIKGERDRLDIMEQNEIDALTKAGITRGAIDRETTVIQRKYASKKAKLSADLNAEASMLAAMQGNYTMAKEAADQAVEDYVFDYQQKVDTFNNVLNTYSDLISDLNQEEKEILKTAATEAQNELDEIKKEKKEVMNLRLQYSNAGISIDDSLEEAMNKAGISAKEYEALDMQSKKLDIEAKNIGIAVDKAKLNKLNNPSVGSDFTDTEKRKLQALGIDYNTEAGYRQAINTLYNPNQYLTNDQRKDKLLTAVTETMQEELGQYFTVDPNRLKLKAEDYLAMQRGWESLSGTSSEFKMYFPIGQYMDEYEQQEYKRLTGSGELDALNSLLNAFNIKE